jgi:transposase
MKIIRVGVDLAKNIFQAPGVDRNEKPVRKRKLKRDEWIRGLLEKIDPECEIGTRPVDGHVTGHAGCKPTVITSN